MTSNPNSMHCPGCGAPMREGEEVCQFCGTPTAERQRKSERIRNEEKKQRKLESLPQMKYVGNFFAAFVWLFTFGFYSFYWYFSRRDALNRLNSGKNFPSVMLLINSVMFMVYIIFGNIDGIISDVIFTVSFFGVIGISAYIAFQVKDMLQSYALSRMNKTAVIKIVAPSGICLFLFGPLYLQYQINKMIDMELMSPEL